MEVEEGGGGLFAVLAGNIEAMILNLGPHIIDSNYAFPQRQKPTAISSSAALLLLFLMD